MNVNAIDALGQQIATAAMRTLIRICPEVRRASPEQLEAACTAMRAASPAVIDQLLADAKAAPWVANLAATNAALTIALEGAKAIRRSAAPHPPETLAANCSARGSTGGGRERQSGASS